MRVIAFRHVPFEDLGLIADSLSEHGIEYEYADLYTGSAPPDVQSAAGLIFMGGPLSVNDELPWLRLEEEIIREAVRRGMPVLGVCLGSQLIARALGARVYRNAAKEIGWYEIALAPEAGDDPLFRGLPARETVFHWHGETFDLPAGAVPLASSERSARQAFRIGRNVYGLQFHLEVTPAMIQDWVRQDANCGDVQELTDPIDAHRDADRMRELAGLVFGRWCDLAHTRTAAR